MPYCGLAEGERASRDEQTCIETGREQSVKPVAADAVRGKKDVEAAVLAAIS